jgi:hypothetical protein
MRLFLQINKFPHPPSIEFQRWMRGNRLVLPHIPDVFFPLNMKFPQATTLVVYKWNMNAIFYNLNAHRFPNLENLYFLSDSTAAIDIPSIFADRNIKYFLPVGQTPEGFDISKVNDQNIFRVTDTDVIPLLYEVPSNFTEEFYKELNLPKKQVNASQLF